MKKTISKFKESIKKEVGGYSESKKRKLFFMMIGGFCILLVLKMGTTYFNVKPPKNSGMEQLQEATEEQKEIIDNSELLTTDQMLENLQQMRISIQEQKKTP